MQNINDLIIKAITYNYPEEIPVNVSILPAAHKKYGKELTEILKKYPSFLTTAANMIMRRNCPKIQVGGYTDVWGCVWDNKQEGMDSYVVKHPLPNREDILTFKAGRNMDCPWLHVFKAPSP